MPRAAKKKKKNMAGRLRGGASLICPKCGSNSSVVITRRNGDEVFRTRQCSKHASHQFQSVETVSWVENG